MRNYLIIIVTFVLSLNSCEINDFCTKKIITPKLIINFKSLVKNQDKKNDIKQVDVLAVWASERDSLYYGQPIDSIAIPLDPGRNVSSYYFKEKNKNTTKIKISYDTKENFISRSCGYEIVFSNIQITLIQNKNNWIDSISKIKIPTINDQKNIHTTFYH